MRILNRQAFLAMPAGTVYSNYLPHYMNELRIKWGTTGADFVMQDLGAPDFEGDTNDEDADASLAKMADEGASVPVDLDCGGRDGFFDQEQKFAVWEQPDVDRLIARLQEARDTAFS